MLWDRSVAAASPGGRRRRGMRLAFAALACLVVTFTGCLSAPYARGTVSELFPQGPRPQDLSYTVDGRTVHYVEQAGGPARILFIHGTPGDWQGWAPYLRKPSLQARATMIAVDRPGWGQSAGGVVPDLATQAAMLRPLLGDSPSGTLLVAHSYGGAIAARMAMDYPRQVNGLVLIAPTLSPELEGPRWYDRLADSLPLRLLLPQKLRRSYAELDPLPQQLQQMLPRWAHLDVPVTLIQGTADGQVDPRTADFAQQELPGQLLRVGRMRGQGHWVLWTKPAPITQAVLDTLQRAAAVRAAGGYSTPRAAAS